MNKTSQGANIEWPTLLLIFAVYILWFAALWLLPLWAAIPVAGVTIALHASLQHEVIHGHPFKSQVWNDAIIWPPLTLAIPYLRFKTSHLAHHHDEILTDPYDDPETNFLASDDWERLPLALKAVLKVNNTIAGRLTIGPMVGTIAFMIADWRNKDAQIIREWAWHVPALIAVIALVGMSPMPIWAYLSAAYLGLSILKLRTFLEHQAHERASGRSVIVEQGGIFGFLFLNNNLHVVHHMHPKVAWYDLPKMYRQRREHYLRRNGGYRYDSYGQIIRQYLFAAKDPVEHPLWRRE